MTFDAKALGPCPFCGGENATLFPPTCDRKSLYNPADRAAPMVRCMGCYAEAVGTDWDATGKSAVTAWNRRASLPHAGKLSEEMVERALKTWFYPDDPDEYWRHWRGSLAGELDDNATEVMRRVLSEALSSQQAEAVPVAPAFDPMNGGCPHCKWLDTNLGHVLDQKCTLHQKIEDLQVDLQMERQISRDTRGVLRAVCEVIRSDDDDDPVEVAKERMAEIDELETAASPVPADAGEPGIKALEWVDNTQGPGCPLRFLARVPFGRLQIYEWGDEWAMNWGGRYGKVVGKTLEAAKAAAQADYEARIRSALLPATSKAKGGAGEDRRLYDADESMADGEIEMTAAENVLAWLIIEKIGVPDDRNYSPNQAQEILVRRLDYANELDAQVLRSSSPVGQTAKEGGE